MIKFQLVLVLRGKKVDPWFLEKTFRRQTLPRLKESVEVGGDLLRVTEVIHRMEEGLTEVHCRAHLYQMAHSYAKNPKGWKISAIDTFRFYEEQFRECIEEAGGNKSCRLVFAKA